MQVKFKENKGLYTINNIDKPIFIKDKPYKVLARKRSQELLIKGEDTYNYWVPLIDVEVIKDPDTQKAEKKRYK